MPTMTLNYTNSEATRFAAALGKAQNLKDNSTPPQPRSATAAECKAFVIGRMHQLVIDIEGRDLTAAAVAAIVVPPFAPN